MECTSTFDVVVANFNNGRFLREMINSVLGQDFDHWTLYITDDCSTDQSRDILDDYKDNAEYVDYKYSDLKSFLNDISKNN